MKITAKNDQKAEERNNAEMLKEDDLQEEEMEEEENHEQTTEIQYETREKRTVRFEEPQGEDEDEVQGRTMEPETEPREEKHPINQCEANIAKRIPDRGLKNFLWTDLKRDIWKKEKEIEEQILKLKDLAKGRRSEDQNLYRTN